MMFRQFSGRLVGRQTSILRRHHGTDSSCGSNAAEFVRAGARGGRNEYAFEMSNSTVRFGIGATAEIGEDLQIYGARRTMVLTDANVINTAAFKSVADSLKAYNVQFDVFDGVKVEPTDVSVKKAVNAATEKQYDAFVAVGGGSTIDTGKCVALMAANPHSDMWEFASAPLGREGHPPKPMLPLIAIPTTAGTGSETTCTAIFTHDKKRVKSGIRHRYLKPHLAIIDPLNVMSMPRHVAIYSGFDVLCHALESYTAKSFRHRNASNGPIKRPVYQGSNPISDVWCQQALSIMADNFVVSVNDPDNLTARANMMLAACYAGVGFGNAGTHLPHGLSYPLSGQVREYRSPDYTAEKLIAWNHAPTKQVVYKPPYNEKVTSVASGPHALIPHGLSVVLTAPAVFEFTGVGTPERHLHAAELLGAHHGDVSSRKHKDAGLIVSDTLRELMSTLKVPNGLKAVEFEGTKDMKHLAGVAFQQQGSLSLSPVTPTEGDLEMIYEKSQTVF